MAIGGISFKIDVDTKQVSSALSGLSSDVQKSSGALKKVSGAVGGFAKGLAKAGTYGLAIKGVSAAVDMVGSSVTSAISRIDTLNNSQRVFQNMGFSAKDSKAMMDNLSKSIQGLPTTLDSAVQGVQLLASSTGDIGKSQEIFAALNNGILGFGGTTEQVQNAITQLSQAFSNGKVDAETWNSMIDSGLGPALGKLAEIMGMTTGELKSGLSDGSVSVEQFQNALIDLNKNGGGGMASLQQIAKDATSGIGTSIELMKTSVVRGVAEVIKGFDGFVKGVTGMGLADIFAGIGSAMENGLKAVVPFLEKLTPIAKTAFDSLRAGFSTVVEFIQPVIAKVSEFVSSFGKTTEAGAIFSSVIDGIKAYISFLVDYWTGIFSGDNSVWNSFTRIFESIKTVAVPILQDAISFIQGILGQLTTFWQENGQQIIAAVQNAFSMIASIINFIMPAVALVIQTVWENIKGVIQGALDIILGLVKVFASLFTGDWSGLWEGIKQLFSGALQFLWNLWNLVMMGQLVGGIKSFVSAGFSSIQGFATNIVNAFKGMLTGASGSWNAMKTAISGAINGAKSIASSAVNAIKSTVSNVFNGLKSTVSSVWNGIKSAITNPIQSAFNVVSGIVNKIKGLFNFKLKFPPIEIPKIPIPYFTISGSFNPLKGQIPKLDIGWKATGGIFTGPSVIGVGEAGDEAVVPLSNKSRMAPFAKAVADFMQEEQQGSTGSRATVHEPLQVTVVTNIDGEEWLTSKAEFITEITEERIAMNERKLGHI